MLNNHETLTGQDFMSFNTFMQLKLLPSKALINHQLIFSTLSTEEPSNEILIMLSKINSLGINKQN
jgi:hypothetical protein